MPYRLAPDRSLVAEIHRAGAEQANRALASLQSVDGADEDAVHDVRKRCKKIRALLRLVRPALGEVYPTENRRFREIARSLAAERDEAISIQTLDDLINRAKNPAERDATQQAKHALLENRDGSPAVGPRDHSPLVTSLQEGAARLEALPLPDKSPDKSFGDLIRPGLKRAYRRAKRAMRDAQANTSDAAVHEWRKRVKDHWYHTRLLETAWKEQLQPEAKRWTRLAKHWGKFTTSLCSKTNLNHDSPMGAASRSSARLKP